MDNDKVSPRYDYARLVPERRRDALDQVEQTVAAWLNVRTVLTPLPAIGESNELSKPGRYKSV